MKKTVIGITGSCLYESSAQLFLGYERYYTNADYVNAVSAGGGVPIMLPIVEDQALIKAQLESVDGVIIMGGYDVATPLFNEEPLSGCGRILPKRDSYEIALIKAATEFKKPLFGICRGLQILNVFFGGTLYQDFAMVKRDIKIEHNQKATPSVRTHSITTTKASLMHKIFGEKELVNSYHHMAIKDLASKFTATAFAPDGIVEAIESNDEHFILGVQFHPEMTAASHNPSLALFKEFIDRCQLS